MNGRRALRLAAAAGLAALAAFPAPAGADDLSLSAGVTERVGREDSSYAWQVSLRRTLLPNIAVSLSWLNEGHLKEDHRDGAVAQAWGLLPFADGRATVGLGAGVYRFYDTRFLPGGGFQDIHGWAPIYSLAVTYSGASPWIAQARVNHVRGPGAVDTNTFLAGIGFRFREAPRGAAPPAGDAASRTTGYELMPFAGETVLNRPDSESGVAYGIEFRMGIDRHIDWTATFLAEDVSEALHRAGLASQFWLVDAYLDRRMTLGFGAGLYAFADTTRAPDFETGHRLDFASLLTLTTSWRVSDRWYARFNWNRVGSTDSHDTDVFVAGIGYRWDQ